MRDILYAFFEYDVHAYKTHTQKNTQTPTYRGGPAFLHHKTATAEFFGAIIFERIEMTLKTLASLDMSLSNQVFLCV